jgi:hypothetical protein
MPTHEELSNFTNVELSVMAHEELNKYSLDELIALANVRLNKVETNIDTSDEKSQKIIELFRDILIGIASSAIYDGFKAESWAKIVKKIITFFP